MCYADARFSEKIYAHFNLKTILLPVIGKSKPYLLKSSNYPFYFEPSLYIYKIFIYQELKTQPSLKIHLRYAHTTVQAHKCNVCDSVFKREFDLLRHMKKHMGTEDWSCEVIKNIAKNSSIVYIEEN